MIPVRELMTPAVVTCSADASLGDVAALLVEHRIHGAFVERAGEIEGVITDTDLLSGEWLGTDATRLDVMREMTAEQMMSSPVATIDVGASAAEAIAALKNRCVSRLLATDGGKPVGVLSIADVVAALASTAAEPASVRDVMSFGIVVCRADAPLHQVARAMTERRSRSVAVLDPESHELAGVLTGRDLLSMAAGDPDGTVVGDVMTSPALTTTPDASISDAADAMLRHEVHRLLVVDPDHPTATPLGLVSTADVMAAMAHPDSIWQRPAPS